MFDFFKTEMECKAKYQEDKEQKVPSCCLLKIDDLITITNIRFDTFLPAFQRNNTQFVKELSNHMLLSLLSAYDKATDKKSKILAIAEDFAEWIISDCKDVIQNEIAKLNQLQIYKRERELTIDEIRDLYTMVENNPQQDEILVGAHLLLGNQIAAEMHFSKLTSKKQEEFKKYPIYHFWKTG